MASVINTATKDTEKLTNKGVVVVWGGTKDVGKNDTRKGLLQIKSFVEKHNQTNITVMSLPLGYDLEANLCINNEVKVFNRK
jgi:hypothetical protein